MQPTWSPDVIVTVVYRVTMTLVSLAFIWMKYRRSTGRFDGTYASSSTFPSFPCGTDCCPEEQFIQGRNSNLPSRTCHRQKAAHDAAQNVSAFLEEQVEDVVQSTMCEAATVDFGDTLDVGGRAGTGGD